MTRTMRIRPNRNCTVCHGTGETVTTPRPGGLALPVFCTCVLKQVHGDPGEIELVKNEPTKIEWVPFIMRDLNPDGSLSCGCQPVACSCGSARFTRTTAKATQLECENGHRSCYDPRRLKEA